MRAFALVALLLAAPTVARAELRTRTRDLGATSAPSGVVDWSTCGTYASGAPVLKGGPVTVARATTSTCTCDPGGEQTAAANQLCVTELGATFEVATSASVTFPTFLTVAGPWVIEAEVHRSTWETTISGTANVVGLGNFGTAGLMSGFITANPPQFNCTVWDGAFASVYRTGLIDTGIDVHRLGCVYTGSGAPLVLIDGKSVSYSTGGAGTGLLGGLPPTMQFGGFAVLSQFFTLGDLSNIIWCRSNNVTSCERSARVAGVTFRRTALRQKKILALGDSITYGTGSTADGPAGAYLPRLLAALGAPWQGTNAGVGSNRTNQMLDRWRATYDSSYYSHVVVLGGINDCSNSVPSATAWANLSALYGEVRASGTEVVPVTILPHNGVAGIRTCLAEVNASIRAWASANGVTVVDAHPWFAQADGTFWADLQVGDGVHPSEAGHLLLSQLIGAHPAFGGAVPPGRDGGP